MTRIELKTQAKKLIEGRFASVFVVPFVGLLVLGLLAAIPVFGGILSLLLSGAVTFAIALIFLRFATKKAKPEFKLLLAGFDEKNLTRSFLGYIRFQIFTALWSLLFVIPGIIKAISYSQMFYLMADDDKMTAGEAQRKSMDMMEGHLWEYFVLELSFIPWYLLTAVTAGIASVYVYPYVETTKALYYQNLKQSSK